MTISNHAMRISSHVIAQKRVSGRSLECNTWLNTMPRPAAWIITVIATRPEAIRSFAIIAALMFSSLLIAAFLKVFDRVCDGSKAVDLANIRLNPLSAQPVPHGGAGLDNLQARASCLDVISHVHHDGACLNVH